MASRVVSEAVSVGTTAAALQSSKKRVLNCLIQAASGNTVLVYVGGADVSTANGVEIAAGDHVLLSSLFASNQTEDWDLSKVYVVSGSASQEVRIMYQEGV